MTVPGWHGLHRRACRRRRRRQDCAANWPRLARGILPSTCVEAQRRPIYSTGTVGCYLHYMQAAGALLMRRVRVRHVVLVEEKHQFLLQQNQVPTHAFTYSTAALYTCLQPDRGRFNTHLYVYLLNGTQPTVGSSKIRHGTAFQQQCCILLYSVGSVK
jgi:hypothetical protein